MASGDTLLTFGAQASTAPSSSFATLDVRNNHVCRDFDPGADESALFPAVMPQHYQGNGIEVRIHYAMTSGETGVVIWEASLERIGQGAQDIDSDSFAAPKSVSSSVPATSGHVEVATIAFSDSEIDGIQPGELFRLRITRDAVGDSAPGDAELFAVEIREQ